MAEVNVQNNPGTLPTSYCLFIQASGQFNIGTLDAGGFTSLTGATQVFNHSKFTIEIVMVGLNMQVLLDGTQLLSYAFSSTGSPLYSGGIGFGTYAANGNYDINAITVAQAYY